MSTHLLDEVCPTNNERIQKRGEKMSHCSADVSFSRFHSHSFAPIFLFSLVLHILCSFLYSGVARGFEETDIYAGWLKSY